MRRQSSRKGAGDDWRRRAGNIPTYRLVVLTAHSCAQTGSVTGAGYPITEVPPQNLEYIATVRVPPPIGNAWKADKKTIAD